MKYLLTLSVCLVACSNPKRDIVEHIKNEKSIIESLKWDQIHTQERQDMENKRLIKAMVAYKKFDHSLFFRYSDTLFTIERDISRHNKTIDSLELELKAY